MSSDNSILASINPYSHAEPGERLQLSEIDRSMKWPGLFFIVSALFWLIFGTVFAVVASIKLTNPLYLGTDEWSTFGRVRTVHLNAVIYGWGFNAAYAVGLWIMARLCHSRVRHAGLLLIAGIFWNFGVTVGIFGILAGDMTSVEWLEMPHYAAPILAVSYALIGVWGIIAFRFRQTGHVYVSQWYILAAIFWLPAIYTAAQVLIFCAPALGVIQSLANWWYVSNLLGLWITPIGLAAAYYFIPKVLGKPIFSYDLATIGFWMLAIFTPWTGVVHMVGGPIPTWAITVSIAASFMMLFPVIVTAINFHFTAFGNFKQVVESPTLRFIVFGAMNYTLVSVMGAAMAFRTVSETTHFTHATVGHAHHGLYAFFTMVMFGAIYFMVPRLLHREWPSALLIRWHFWSTALGVTLMVVALIVGGVIQGNMLNDPAIPFLDVVRETLPWLNLRTMGGIMIALGHFAFFLNLLWMVFARAGREDTSGQATRFEENPLPGSVS